MPSNKSIRLSVLLSAYNAEKFIQESIGSILNQSFTEFELLIADDGSTDRTKEMIDSFHDDRIILSHNTLNIGKIRTINRLFRISRGELVTIHDADDISVKERFEEQVNFLQNHPEFGFVGTNFAYIHRNGKIFRKINLETDPHLLRKKMMEYSQFHGPTVIFRRSLLLGNELIYRVFFEDYNEDYDLCFRMIQKTEATNLPDILYKYRIVPGSYSKRLTPRKKVMSKIVQHLASQRESEGIDDLMRNNLNDVQVLLSTLLVPYQKDSSLIFRENAQFQMYFGLYSEAIRNSFRGFIEKPNFNNFMTLQYCLRKTVLGV